MEFTAKLWSLRIFNGLYATLSCHRAEADAGGAVALVAIVRAAIHGHDSVTQRKTKGCGEALEMRPLHLEITIAVVRGSKGDRRQHKAMFDWPSCRAPTADKATARFGTKGAEIRRLDGFNTTTPSLHMARRLRNPTPLSACSHSYAAC